MLKIKLNLREAVVMAICFAGAATMTAQNADVYVAGGGKVLKNNVELYSVADADVNFYCMYVYENDVYTGGIVGYYYGTVWKNGTLLFQSTTSSTVVNSVSVSNGNVYACGDNGYDAVVWRNGTILYTLAQGSSRNPAYATSMQIIGSDIYVAGYEGLVSGKVWKNGTLLYNVGENEGYYISDIAISDNDVYVTGYTNGVAKVWKNGVELYSENGAFSSISINGNDVYVAGYTPNIIGTNKFAKVWKNGTVLYQLSDGTTDARAENICFFNNDVYFSTTTFTYPSQHIIWKNGVKLYDMGSQGANAICIRSSSNTPIANIERQNLQIYPNPVKDELFIQSETDINKIEIYDIAGKQMLTGNLSSGKSINVSVLPAGVYVLKIGDYREKFVKE